MTHPDPASVTDPARSPQTRAVDATATWEPTLEAPAAALDFTAIYRAHFPWVWRALRRLGIREADLADLTHDVFVVVHRKLPAFEVARPMKPWLFGIAFRVALDKKRRHSSFKEALGDDVGERHATGAFDSAIPAADELVAAREAHDTVMCALAALGAEQRAVFVMHELEGLSMPDIADVVEAPINTLYSRLRLAREAFVAAVRAQHSKGAL